MTLSRSPGISGRALVALAAAVALVVCSAPHMGAAAGAGGRSRPGGAAEPFHAIAGRYVGHERVLTINGQGRMHVDVYVGCCDEVSNIRYQLSHLGRHGARRTATATITRVISYDTSWFDHPPQQGQRTRLRVRGPVAWLGGLNYCGPSAPVGYCGD